MKRFVKSLRRAHLYVGLFLFPWAILYGVTAFLFNHPTALADQPVASFGRAELAGTPLEAIPTPSEQAEAVVAELTARRHPATPYRLAGPARPTRQFAFATVATETQTLSLLFDSQTGVGTVRSAPTKPKVELPAAPFATAVAPPASPPSLNAAKAEAVRLADPLHERIRAATPLILERVGFPAGDVTVTSVPDLAFPVEADGGHWDATYNPLTGAVTAVPAGSTPAPAVSLRRFLLRLHTAHGYSTDVQARWYWAIVVDAMAAALCAWGLTGVVMWWQLKATRRVGALVLVLGALCGLGLGAAMRAVVTS